MKTGFYYLLTAIRAPFAAACLLAFTFGFSIPKASAQIIPVSQTRTISSSYSSGPPDNISTNASASAVGFGVFNTSVQTGFAGAGQNSEIDTATISASGAANGGLPPGTLEDGTGYSDFSVTFDLASACSYSLTGSLYWAIIGAGSSAPTVSLSSTNGTVFQLAGFNFGLSGTVPFSTNGVLPSGEYTLTGHAQGVFYHGENENYNLSLSVTPVPEPAVSTLLVLGFAALLGLRRPRPLSPN